MSAITEFMDLCAHWAHLYEPPQPRVSKLKQAYFSDPNRFYDSDWDEDMEADEYWEQMVHIWVPKYEAFFGLA